MKKFIIDVSTNWCGEENSYAAYAENSTELEEIAQNLAWENFTEFDGLEGIKGELFPDSEDYTDEQNDEAIDVERDYYSYDIREVETEEEETEFSYLDIVYDKKIEPNEEV